MAFRYAVALTGGIATGKSTVAKLLKSWGFSVIDADTIAHNLLNEQKDAVAAMFGEHLLSPCGIDRKALGEIVFSDKNRRKKLEALLHPLIYERIVELSQAFEQKQKLYFIDIPLFFEGERYPIEKVLVVYAPKTKQLQRLMQRDKSTQTQAQQRIDAQIDIEDKAQSASYVIYNRGTLAELEQETLRVIEEIQKDFK